jgi:spore maturation protein CgeB
MFRVLARSKITVNNHISIAGNYANNMRLYEATGMGALLVTGRKSNIAEIFESGSEIVCYDSPEALNWSTIIGTTRQSAAGQRRMLDAHSYVKRTKELLGIFEDEFGKRQHSAA